MFIYIVLVGNILLLRIFFLNLRNRKFKKVYLILASLPIILITGLRYRFIGGNDSWVYYNHYLLSQKMEFTQFMDQTRMENGFDIFVKFFSSMFHNPQYIYVISGIFFMVFTGYYFYKNSSEPMLSMIFYVTLGPFFFTLMGLRQSIAMNICLISIEFIKERKFLYFFITVIFASFFHKTAIVFLPMYFIAYRKVNVKNNILTLLGVIIVLLSYQSIISFANELFDSDYKNIVTSGGFVVVAIYLLTLLIAYVHKNNININKNNLIFINMTIIGFVTYLLRYVAALASERISFYFFYGLLIILPEVISSITNRKERQLYYFIALSLSISLYFYRLTKTPALVPYQFFWE